MSLFIPLDISQSDDQEPDTEGGDGSPRTSPEVGEGDGTGQERTAWEIDFVEGEARKPRKPMPRFLRERLERMEQAKKNMEATTPPPTTVKSKTKLTFSSGSKSKTKTSPALRSTSRSPSAIPTQRVTSDARVSGTKSPLSSDKTKRSPVLEKTKKSPVSRFSLLSRKRTKLQEPSKPSEPPSERGRGTISKGASPGSKSGRSRPSSASKSSPSLAPGTKRDNKRPMSSPASVLRTSLLPRLSSPKPTLRERQLTKAREGRDREDKGGPSRDQLSCSVSTTEPSVSEEDEQTMTTGSEESTLSYGTAWEITDSGSKGRREKPEKPSKRVGSSSSTSSRALQPRRLMKMTIPYREEEEGAVARVATTPQEMAQRKMLDLKRWYCMSHPQYSRSCGISSVVSCWNYLFSTLGNGSLPPLTQEEALTILGFQPPFSEIRFGSFTGNVTVMRWFKDLCCHSGLSAQAYYFYKPSGKGKTFGLRPELALERLKSGLSDPSMAFVYHCHNHYFCPVGYEEVPKSPTDAFKVGISPKEVDSWVLIGEPSRTQPGLQCKRWRDIVTDLTCESPNYFNIRHTERGVQTRRTKKVGGNLHCIMAFKKLEDTDGLMYVTPEIHLPVTDVSVYRDELESAPSEDLESSDSDQPDHGGDVVKQPRRRDSIELDPPDSAAIEEVDTFQVLSYDMLDSGSSEVKGHSGCEGTTQGKNTPASLEEEWLILPAPQFHTQPNLDVPELSEEVKGGSDESPDWLSRSGTYKKKKPSLPAASLPTADESFSTADDDAHSTTALSTDGPDSTMEGRRKRSGTFTKDGPSLNVPSTNPTISIFDETDFNVDCGRQTKESPGGRKRSDTFMKESPALKPSRGDQNSGSENTDYYDRLGSPNKLKRSGTFTKEKPALTPSRVDQHSDSEDTDDDLSGNPSKLKRSGTYTKEKPALKSSRVDQHSDSENTDDDLSGSPSKLKRSGTYTKEKPALKSSRVDQHSDSEDTDDDLSGSPSKLKRSGTLTKENLASSPTGDQDSSSAATGYPNHNATLKSSEMTDKPALEPYEDRGALAEWYRIDPDPDEVVEETDLDRTLTNLSAEQLDITDDSDSEGSVEETIVVSASGLKRSGTFTKEKPTLSDRPVVDNQ